MADVVLVGVAFLITLAIFLAVRPLWRSRDRADHGPTVDNGGDSREEFYIG